MAYRTLTGAIHHVVARVVSVVARWFISVCLLLEVYKRVSLLK